MVFNRIIAQVRRTPQRNAYSDLAMMPVSAEEADLFELFTHTDAARSEVARVRAVAALTQGPHNRQKTIGESLRHLLLSTVDTVVGNAQSPVSASCRSPVQTVKSVNRYCHHCRTGGGSPLRRSDAVGSGNRDIRSGGKADIRP